MTVRYTIENDHLTVSADSLGAQLASIRSKDGIEYLWQGDPAFWSDRALNIFPYVARLTENSYYMDGEKHEMGIHGFAAQSEFALTEHSGDAMTLTLTDSPATYRQYPRRFRFSVRYALKGNVLETRYIVENLDERTMYFGLGGHPGFNVPMGDGGKFEDYRLRFDTPCKPMRVHTTPACYLDDKDVPYPLEEDRLLPLRHDLFDEDAVILREMSRKVTLENVATGRYVTVSYPQMPYLGIWHWPKKPAPYLCIEPWCSLPSHQDEVAVFEDQKDLIRLGAGETYTNVWTIEMG
ncbi:MAG: aldose 1-epimerase family protein [Clostridia bacterium]|nr:aldose 1-epimerase family protein [Clostridia bacterium]